MEITSHSRSASAGKHFLYVMHADGLGTHELPTDALGLQGAPAWAHGQSITSAANDFAEYSPKRPAFVQGYLSASNDRQASYPVKAATADAAAYPLPALTLTRGAHLALQLCVEISRLTLGPCCWLAGSEGLSRARPSSFSSALIILVGVSGDARAYIGASLLALRVIRSWMASRGDLS